MSYAALAAQAAEYILSKTDIRPRAGLVLGSGWGELAGKISSPVTIPYGQVPGMRASTVPGHAGEWVLGYMGNTPVAVMSGRLHYYEGYSLQDIVFPIRIMSKMGIESLVLTNATGAVNKSYVPGDLMLISDHINFAGLNPLMGPNEEAFGTRFPDMSRAYSPELLALARQTAQDCGLQPKEGVYCWITGPSFETSAEIRMFRMLGADAVGMSTVPEVIAANHAGIRVAGVSCMTNMAAGILDQPLTHQEVLETMDRVKPLFSKFLFTLMSRL